MTCPERYEEHCLSDSKNKIMENTGERALPDQSNIYEFNRIYSLVADLYGGKEKTILDYGCGTGYGIYELTKHFGNCLGIDVSADTIDFCKNTFASESLFYDIFDPSTQPFPDEYFDCIFSFQVFEHIPLNFTEQYLRNIFSMLKYGGVGIITTPNANNYSRGYSGNKFGIYILDCNAHSSLFAFFALRTRRFAPLDFGLGRYASTLSAIESSAINAWA